MKKINMQFFKVHQTTLTGWLFTFFLLASYVIPMLTAFYHSNVFIYVNAWDEETYLTLQMSEHIKSMYGYFLSSSITRLFQSISISGSLQNLIFDLLVIPTIFYFVFVTFLRLGTERKRALLYASIVLFCSVLFNYSNPFILNIYGSARHVSTIMPGWESYPSILRTPEPQLSYLLVSLAVAVWAKTKKWYILLIPIPFLYVFVTLGYCFVLFSILIIKLYQKNIGSKYDSLQATTGLTIAPALSTYTLCALTFLVGSYLIEQASGKQLEELIPKVADTRQVNIPIAFLFILPCMIYLYTSHFKGKKIGQEGLYSIVLGWIVLLLANMQIISGFTISFKNLHDYTLNIISGLSICLFLESAYKHELANLKILSAFKWLILTTILIFSALSQGFTLNKLSYRVWVGKSINQEELSKIKKDPSKAIIPDRNLSAKVAYANAGMKIPPFSYQYKHMPNDQHNMNSAIEAARLHYKNDSKQLKHLENIYNKLSSKPNQSPPLIMENIHPSSYFFIEPKGEHFIWFPNWEPKQ